nr:hypothetical protein [Tanacetum cinerariifolium]
MVKHAGDHKKDDDHGETSKSTNKQELVAHQDDSNYYDCQTPTSDDHKIPPPTLPSPPRKNVHKRMRRSSDDGTTAEFFEKTRHGEETIRIEYEWEPPRYSTWLIFSHSPVDCPKAAPKRADRMDKGKDSVKPNILYRPKAKQSNVRTSNSAKATPFIILEGAMGRKATTSGTQEEGQSTTPIVEKINVLEKHILEGKLVLANDEEKSLEKVGYLDNLDSDDEVEPIDNETANFLALNLKRVGYGLKSLWEQ